MKDFLTALGLVFVIEGMLLTLMPGRVKQLLNYMNRYSSDSLRNIGFGAVIVGAMWVWMVKY